MPVIPWPSQYQTTEGQFECPDSVAISYHGEGLARTAELLRDHLETRLQLTCSLGTAEEVGDTASISLVREGEPIQSLASLPNGQDGYQLDVGEARVVVRGQSAQGVFHGVQSLLQMLPSSPLEGGISLDCVQVRLVWVLDFAAGSKLACAVSQRYT